VQHGLGRRHDHDDVRPHERGVDPQGHRSRGADLDQVLTLDVVHLDVAVEAARERRRHEPFEQLLAGAPGQPAGDEQCLVPAWDAQPLELVDGRLDRRLARVALAPGEGQSGRLDDHRRPAAGARHERLERLAREWEAQSVANGGADVGDPLAGRRRAQHDVVLFGGHDDEARTGEQRHPGHGGS
jgi:hypothetical protein